jgi:hypothetical protein
MKEKYEDIISEIVVFDTEDVIDVSSGDDLTP